MSDLDLEVAEKSSDKVQKKWAAGHSEQSCINQCYNYHLICRALSGVVHVYSVSTIYMLILMWSNAAVALSSTKSSAFCYIVNIYE